MKRWSWDSRLESLMPDVTAARSSACLQRGHWCHTLLGGGGEQAGVLGRWRSKSALLEHPHSQSPNCPFLGSQGTGNKRRRSRVCTWAPGSPGQALGCELSSLERAAAPRGMCNGRTPAGRCSRFLLQAGGWAVGSELRRICRKRHHLHPNPSTLNNRAEAVFVLECSFTDGSHLYCYGTIQTLLGSTVSLKQKWEPPPDVMGIPPPPRAAPA